MDRVSYNYQIQLTKYSKIDILLYGLRLIRTKIYKTEYCGRKTSVLMFIFSFLSYENVIARVYSVEN